MTKRLLPLIVFAAAASTAQATPLQDDIGQFLQKQGLMQSAGKIGETIQQATSRAGDLIKTAMGNLGVPYRLGGESADTGFDCSGLVRAVFRETAGLVLPRRAEEQAAATQKIEKDDLKPGDLVFFNTLRRAYSHVGIYMGEGKFIHAPRTGAQVRVEDMKISYWQTRFNGARRVALGGDADKQVVSEARGSAVINRASPAPSAVRLGAGLFGGGTGSSPANAEPAPAAGENI